MLFDKAVAVNALGEEALRQATRGHPTFQWGGGHSTTELIVAMALLLHTTQLCEAVLSKLTIIKFKNRFTLKHLADVLREALSCIILRMDYLCINLQPHLSH